MDRPVPQTKHYLTGHFLLGCVLRRIVTHTTHYTTTTHTLYYYLHYTIGTLLHVYSIQDIFSGSDSDERAFVANGFEKISASQSYKTKVVEGC